jgi:di/tricarboxylate transporter
MESATTRVDGVRADTDRSAGRSSAIRRFSTETKQAFKTTEFWAMVVVIVGILVAAASIKGGDTTGTDEFIAKQAWLYVAIVAVGYMVSRGLAKSGSREPYDADRDDGEDRRH